MKFRNAILLLAAITAAIGAIVGLRWRTANVAEHRAAILQRRIPSIDFDGVSSAEALHRLQAMTGVRIDSRMDEITLAPETGAGGSLGAPHTERDSIHLHLKNATLMQAMDAIMWRIRERIGTAGYDLVDDAIVVAPIDELRRSAYIYDIRDLIRPNDGEPSGWLGTVICIAFDTEYSKSLPISRHLPSPERCAEGLARGWLVLVESPLAHQRSLRLLDAVRRAKRDGTGPAAARGDRDGGPREIRVYDVSDLANAIYTPFVGAAETDIDYGADAIADALIKSSGDPAAGYNGGGFYEFANRIIVDAAPAQQADVRRRLSEIRAGRGVEGLQLPPKKR